MTRDELIKKFPRASEAFIQANLERLRAAEPELPARVPLECPAPRKAKSGPRLEIRFDIYSRRPLDWDNAFTKQIQDLLIVSGIIPDDSYDILQGRVVSHKAHNAEEERTEIEIYEVIEGTDSDTI